MDKVVLVKELKSGTTKGENSKTYPIVCDQNNELWNIWQKTCPLELGKVYLFTFHVNDKGYKDIEKITPLVNIFKQEALKEMASKSDIKKDYVMCLSYAKDLTVGNVIKIDELFNWTEKMYEYIKDKTNSEFEKINNSGINLKEIK